MTEITFLPSSGLFDTKAGLYARLAAAVPSMYAVVRPSCSCVRVVFDMVFSVFNIFLYISSVMGLRDFLIYLIIHYL